MSEFNILRDRLNINKFLVILVFNGSTDEIVFFASLTPVFVKFDILVLDESLFLFDLATHGEICGGSCDEDGRQRTEDHTEDHGKSKAADACSTEDEDTEQHDEGRHRGVDGTCERLVERVVEERLQLTLLV